MLIEHLCAEEMVHNSTSHVVHVEGGWDAQQATFPAKTCGLGTDLYSHLTDLLREVNYSLNFQCQGLRYRFRQA